MGKMIIRLLVMGCLLTALTVAENLSGGLRAVLAGVDNRQKAEETAAEAAEILKNFPTAASRIAVRKNLGLWLVEIGPLDPGGTQTPVLLSALSKHYPGILVLGKEKRKIPSQRGVITTAGSSHPSEKRGRGWEWLILTIMALSGYAAYRLRGRRLRRLGVEQEMLETRQRSLRLKLKGAERGNE